MLADGTFEEGFALRNPAAPFRGAAQLSTIPAERETTITVCSRGNISTNSLASTVMLPSSSAAPASWAGPFAKALPKPALTWL